MHRREQQKWSQNIHGGVRTKNPKPPVVSCHFTGDWNSRRGVSDCPTLLTLASASRSPEHIPTTLHPVRRAGFLKDPGKEEWLPDCPTHTFYQQYTLTQTSLPKLTSMQPIPECLFVTVYLAPNPKSLGDSIPPLVLPWPLLLSPSWVK